MANIVQDAPLDVCGVNVEMAIGEEPLIGSGNWPGCHGAENYHAATVYIDFRRRPDYVTRNWAEIWRRVVAAYGAIGLKLIEIKDDQAANLHLQWVLNSSGWIGLAIIGRDLKCNDHIWAKFLAPYKGGETDEEITNQWTTLVLHEIGHNCGLPHSRGGIMSPSIVKGLPPTWVGDPSESILRRWYGGKPVPAPPTEEPKDVASIIKQLLLLLAQWAIEWINSGGVEKLDEELRAVAAAPPKKVK